MSDRGSAPHGSVLAQLARPFVYCLCAVGHERELKAEIARLRPEWRPAFGRPGFVTFKTPEPVGADVALESVFARSHGVAFAPSDDFASIVRGFSQDCARLGAERVARLAVIVRGAGAYAELEPELEALARDREAALRAELGEAIASSHAGPPNDGDVVFDVIVRPGEPEWRGVHVHDRSRASAPGGLLPVVLRPDAPSRAYLKLEEAVARFGLELRRGEQALELGCSPGGITLALLARGLDVVGVDPGAMDPRLSSYELPGAKPRLWHVRQPVGALRRADLPRPLHWIVSDMNLAPRVVLRYLERAVGPSRSSLLGAVVTFKLNDLAMADEIPAYCERLVAMGFGRVRATQLPSNRREVCAVALTERGLHRGTLR